MLFSFSTLHFFGEISFSTGVSAPPSMKNLESTHKHLINQTLLEEVEEVVAWLAVLAVVSGNWGGANLC
jgi:hypothetical protein